MPRETCPECGSCAIRWFKDQKSRRAWGICQECGATVEIAVVHALRKKIGDAFRKLGYPDED
jgi:transcription elongation factor Elf1